MQRKEFKEIHQTQEAIAKQPDKTAFTTVGFEFDYLKLAKDDPLAKLAHYTVAKSSYTLNGLSYLLETDAGNILEFVTPPYYVKRGGAGAKEEMILPGRQQILLLRQEIYDNLKHAIEGRETLGDLIAYLNADGLGMQLTGEAVEAHHMMGPQSPTEGFTKEDLLKKKVARNTTGGFERPQISMMVDFEGLMRIYQPKGRKLRKALDAKRRLYNVIGLNKGPGPSGPQAPRKKVPFILNLLEKTIEDHLAVQSLALLRDMQSKYFTGQQVDSKRFRFHAHLSSLVKDRANIWIRSDMLTIIHNELNPQERQEVYKEIKKTVTPAWIEKAMTRLLGAMRREGLHRDQVESYTAFLKDRLDGHLAKIVDPKYAKIQQYGVKDINEHDDEVLGIRQDTFIDPETLERIRKNMGFPRKLYVVEMRNPEDVTRLPDDQGEPKPRIRAETTTREWLGLQ